MGLAASQARFLHITGQLTFVQRQGQCINQQRAALAGQMNQASKGTQVGGASPYFRGGGDTPDYHTGSGLFGGTSKGKNKNQQNKSEGLFSSMVDALSNYPGANLHPAQLDTGKLAALQAQDAQLEMLLYSLGTQEKALKTEIDAVKKVISKNVESSFKAMA